MYRLPLDVLDSGWAAFGLDMLVTYNLVYGTLTRNDVSVGSARNKKSPSGSNCRWTRAFPCGPSILESTLRLIPGTAVYLGLGFSLFQVFVCKTMSYSNFSIYLYVCIHFR